MKTDLKKHLTIYINMVFRIVKFIVFVLQMWRILTNLILEINFWEILLSKLKSRGLQLPNKQVQAPVIWWRSIMS